MSTYFQRDRLPTSFEDVPLEWSTNRFILAFWTANHDALLEAAILTRGFSWPWGITNQIVAATPPDKLATWREHDPLASQYAWYNVLMYFAISRARRLNLTSLIPPPTRKLCRICQEGFLDQGVPLPLIERLGLDRVNYCAPCLTSRLLSEGSNQATRAQITAYLADVARLIQRVPNQGYGRSKHDLQGLTDDERDQVLRLLERKPSARRVARVCGSWLGALIEAGVLPDGTRPMPRGTMTVAQDGHVCRSLAEKTIDDWLSAQGVPHEREPRYPGSAYKADWLVRGVFVEYFGLLGNPEYDARAAEKRGIAKEHALVLVEIVPTDLLRDGGLAKRLAPVLQWAEK